MKQQSLFNFYSTSTGSSKAPPAQATETAKPKRKAPEFSQRFDEVKRRARAPSVQERKRRNDELKKSRNQSKFAFTLAEKIRDGAQRRPSHPDYDKRTIFVPPSALSSFTPFEAQFWALKKDLYDTVVFFRKGMFYELFECDADIMQREFGLSPSFRSSMRMVGFPAKLYDEKAAVLLAKNYKIARVDQTESKNAKQKRQAAVIERKITDVTTPGTVLDPMLLSGSGSNFLLSVYQRDHASRIFGICFIEVATFSMHVGWLEDDAYYSHLETLLLRVRPREVVTLRSNASADVMALLHRHVGARMVHVRQPDTDFWDADATRAYLKTTWNTNEYPPALRNVDRREDCLYAIGGVLGYLQELLVVDRVLPLCQVSAYDSFSPGSLAVDAQTLLNLEVFENNRDGGKEGTLLRLLDHTVTPAGSRLLRRWVYAPLARCADINARLDAIDELNKAPDWQGHIRRDLKKLPDLERLLGVVHSGTLTPKRFLQVLKGFESLWETVTTHLPPPEEVSINTSPLLEISTPGEGLLLDMQPIFQCFTCVDRESTDSFTIKRGYNEERDLLEDQYDAIVSDLTIHLKELKSKLNCPKLVYKHVGNKPYLLEVPIELASKVPVEFVLIKSTTKVLRYRTPFVERRLPLLDDARDALQLCDKEIFGQMRDQLMSYQSLIATVVGAVATLDCLLSGAQFSLNNSQFVCRPQISPLAAGSSFLEARGLLHAGMLNQPNTVKNDVLLGFSSAHPKCQLITGPNMGGKSTLLRSVCLAALMSHIGSYVPAESFRMSAVDRIFTRIGARDNIFAGQSTFMVEMLETSNVLRHATADSLVILDELGRGTSTFDGFSIAHSVLATLAQKGCRTMFSTHFHTLTQEFSKDQRVALVHMNALFLNGTLTFLYKLEPGACSESYGMNVARMAGLPQTLIHRATTVSEQAKSLEQRLSFKRIWSADPH